MNAAGHTGVENLYAIGESAGFLGSTASGWGFSGSITVYVTISVKIPQKISPRTILDDDTHPISVSQKEQSESKALT